MLKKLSKLICVWMILCFYLIPSSAEAHAYVANSDPLQESELQEAPKKIRVKFTEKININLSQLTLLDAEGKVIKTKQSGEDSIWLILEVPPLQNGVYRVQWQALSLDTHVTDGSFRFSVGVPLPKIRPQATVSLDDVADSSTKKEERQDLQKDQPASAPKTAETSEKKSKDTQKPTTEKPVKETEEKTSLSSSSQTTGKSAENKTVPTPTEKKENIVETEKAVKKVQSDNDDSLHDHHLHQQHGNIAEHNNTLENSWNTFLRVFEIVTAIMVGGIVFFRNWVWGGNQREAIYVWSSLRTERTICLSGLLLFCLTGCGQVLLLAEKLSHSTWSDPILWQKAGVLVTSTALGVVSWLRPVIMALLLAMTFDLMPQGQVSGWTKFIMVGALMFTFPFTGHAFSSEAFWGIPIISHGLHMMAAAVWFGGLIGLTFQSFILRKNTVTLKLMNSLLIRFSSVALPMVLLVAVTGVILSVLRLGSWADFITSQYGQILLWKIAIFSLTLMIASYHRFVIMPQIHKLHQGELDTQSTIHRLFWGIRAELLLAFGVILLAGMLSTSPPPT